ncbi:hypothetical protein DSO57_1007148 [Entomophthora muscae]|uniref:Uncharacterized protein n=1 Tax=Entomophthora muscae TaxID=34485 RepID=A0ACC2T795_9FUNG|nr:hypothetical protein DSO57_1007148 [Entomophthora muscae]
MNSQTSFNKISYAAAIYSGETFLCSGAFYRQDIVISTGSCSQFPAEYYWVNKKASLRRGRKYLVSSIHVHPLFQMFNAHTKYDIAIMTLYKSSSGPAMLNVDPGSLMDVTLYGWGTFSSLTPTSHLLKTPGKILSIEDCQGETAIDAASELCIAHSQIPGHGCFGDIGSPAIQNNQLVGIQTWGDSCSDVNPKTVYTNVSYFSSWIKRSVAAIDHDAYHLKN